MTYNFGQLQQIWSQSGGNSQLAPIMAAISLAESGGNPSAINTNDTNGQGGTQTSAGLWQISNGTNTAFSTNWSNPIVNGAAAVQKVNSQGLNAWGTFQSGAYLQYLPPEYQGSYLQNIIAKYASPNAGGVPNTLAAADYATTAASTASTSSPKGMAGVLMKLDKVLNPTPSSSSFLGSLIDVSGTKEILGRGIVALVGVGILYMGFKQITTGKSGGGSGSGILEIATENRRISQLQNVEAGKNSRQTENLTAKADAQRAQYQEQQRQQEFTAREQRLAERRAAAAAKRQSSQQSEAERAARVATLLA